MSNKNGAIFFDELDDAVLAQLDLDLSTITQKPSSCNPTQPSRSVTVSAMAFSPPRELSQIHRTTEFDSLPHSPPSPLFPVKPNSFSDFVPALPPQDSDKDLEIERLKVNSQFGIREFEEKECQKLKKERDKKEDQPKFVPSKNEGEKTRTNCSKSIDKDSGVIAQDYLKNSSKFQNGVSSKDMTVETTFKDKGVETDMFKDNLSQKLLEIWGSQTDKKLGTNAISKLLVGCQRNFHILFGCMSMRLPSEITKELLTASSGVGLHYVEDCFHTPEAAKVSDFYVALTKINDGTDVLETLIQPLLDLCDIKNVVIVHSSLCILHNLLKLLVEMVPNFGRRDNIFIDGVCIGKDDVDCCGLEGAKDRKLFNEETIGRKECWSHQSTMRPNVNWLCLFEIMHQIGMKITEESVRVEAVSIMNLVLVRSDAYNERALISQKIVFETISELLKKEAGLLVRKHALKLLYLVLNCPEHLATFCCGCKEGDGATDDNACTSEFQNFKIILQGLADCVIASHGSGLLELNVSRNAILVLAFLASSGKPGFEILVGHKLPRGVNYLMLILQLLVSEMDLEGRAYNVLPEIFKERTFLIREIMILLNRLVSSPAYSATVLRVLTATRDMATLTIDVTSRLSRKIKKNEQQDSMVKHIRETEIVDLARLFKKRVFTYLGDDIK
ncbi:hypothetical protein TanjilG_25488 [Lupinus angustifolius]|uniref:Uncharacterized protein n=1 Tax=Lupinus angustifolius TaxID=3871 RepID=A0A4P1QT02_LUPAN|nr:hypothetical protein TanjilG_25488 [Lupinus angustifolius]